MDRSGPVGTSLVRTINERGVLRALLDYGPLTRPEIAAYLDVSKPTASQLLLSLQEARLVEIDRLREGLPGRAAEVYRINGAAAYVAALDVTPQRIAASAADLSGAHVGEFELLTPGRSGGNPVERVRSALEGVCAPAGISIANLRRVVIGIQGAVDPGTDRLRFAAHIPGWHIPDLVRTLRTEIGVPIDIENDVNLVAIAERAHGTARGQDNFALMWVSDGVGMALVLGGRLHRGLTGGAGEIADLPVPGAPTADEVGPNAAHGMQALAGGRALHAVLRSHGFRGRSPVRAMRAAAAADPAADPADSDSRAALDEVARRIATGLAGVTALIDPDLIVLSGDIVLAGGEPLRGRIQDQLRALAKPRPPLRLSTLTGNPVLDGARQHAITVIQDEVVNAVGT